MSRTKKMRMLSRVEANVYVRAKNFTLYEAPIEVLAHDGWIEAMLASRPPSEDEMDYLRRWLFNKILYPDFKGVKMIIKCLKLFNAKLDKIRMQFLFNNACSSGNVKIVCLIRRLAARLGIDVNLIAGFEKSVWHGHPHSMCLLRRWTLAHPRDSELMMLGNGKMIFRAAHGGREEKPGRQLAAIKLLMLWGDSAYEALGEARRYGSVETGRKIRWAAGMPVDF